MKPRYSNSPEIPETYGMPLERNEGLIFSLRTYYYLCLSLVAPGVIKMYTHIREWVGSKTEAKKDSIKIMHRLRSETEREKRNRVNRDNMST